MRSDAMSNLDALSVGELRHLYETYRSASQLFGWRPGSLGRMSARAVISSTVMLTVACP